MAIFSCLRNRSFPASILPVQIYIIDEQQQANDISVAIRGSSDKSGVAIHIT
jgi:hypothetical protein